MTWRRGQQERAERIQTRREMGLEPEVEEYANADDNDPFTTNLCVSRNEISLGTLPSSMVSLAYQWCKTKALTVGKKAKFTVNRGPNLKDFTRLNRSMVLVNQVCWQSGSGCGRGCAAAGVWALWPSGQCQNHVATR